MSTYNRFWSHVDRRGGPAGCWPWIGETNRDGNGVFRVRGRRTTARRFAFSAEYGDPGPLRVRLRCGTPSCCNPRHATVATAAAVATSNGSAATRNAAATHCPRGHLLRHVATPAQSRRRDCARCKADRTRASRLRRRDATTGGGQGGGG